MSGIPIISEFIPVSSGIPVSDAIFIRGGYQAVDTGSDLNNIPATLKKEGMLVYVTSSGINYRYISGSWTPHSNTNKVLNVSGINVTLNHNLGYYPNISILDPNGNLLLGQIAHVTSNQMLLTFSESIKGTGYLS